MKEEDEWLASSSVVDNGVLGFETPPPTRSVIQHCVGRKLNLFKCLGQTFLDWTSGRDKFNSNIPVVAMVVLLVNNLADSIYPYRCWQSQPGPHPNLPSKHLHSAYSGQDQHGTVVLCPNFDTEHPFVSLQVQGGEFRKLPLNPSPSSSSYLA